MSSPLPQNICTYIANLSDLMGNSNLAQYFAKLSYILKVKPLVVYNGCPSLLSFLLNLNVLGLCCVGRHNLCIKDQSVSETVRIGVKNQLPYTNLCTTLTQRGFFFFCFFTFFKWKCDKLMNRNQCTTEF